MLANGIGRLLFGSGKLPAAPPAQVEAEYEVMTIAPADRTLTSVYSATIRGRQDIEIYPQVSGFLTKVCVTEGEHVRQGQTLFIIDQVAYEAALQTAQANVKAAEASLATAQLTYEQQTGTFPPECGSGIRS